MVVCLWHVGWERPRLVRTLTGRLGGTQLLVLWVCLRNLAGRRQRLVQSVTARLEGTQLLVLWVCLRHLAVRRPRLVQSLTARLELRVLWMCLRRLAARRPRLVQWLWAGRRPETASQQPQLQPRLAQAARLHPLLRPLRRLLWASRLQARRLQLQRSRLLCRHRRQLVGVAGGEGEPAAR